MTDSPRIPYLLWPLAIVFAFMIAYTVNVIERNWRTPKTAALGGLANESRLRQTLLRNVAASGPWLLAEAFSLQEACA